MKKVLLVTMFLFASWANAAIQMSDHFDNGVIDTGLWTAAAGFVESGTLISAPGGNFMSSNSNYQDNLYFGLRNVFDSRVPPYFNYGTYTLGYTGYSSLLLRNDNQGGGFLAVQGWYYPNYITLTGIGIGDNQPHNIDAAFEWTPAGLLISLDDLGTPGLDVQSLIGTSSPYYIAPASMQIWNNAGQTSNALWSVDFIQVGIPEPATLAIFGLGSLLALKRRTA